MSFQIGSPVTSAFNTPATERPPAKRQQSGWRPPVAPSPYERGAPVGQPQDGYFAGAPTSVPQPPTSRSGLPTPMSSQQASTPQMYGQPSVDGLNQQFGQMGMDGAGSQPVRKKKDRHAYHQIEQPQASAQQYNGMQNGAPNGQAGQNGQAWQQTSQPWQSQSLNQPPMPSPMPQGTPISMDSGQHGQQGAPGSNRVDPNQIPSVPLSRDTAAEHYKTHVYPTMEQHVPPPATTSFVAFDQGSASPKHARLTLNTIPSSNEQLHHTGLPLGLVLQPLAKQAEGEQAIPVLDFGDVGPPRCRRCRAYINPFMIFSNGGNRMTCNLCGHPNEVGPEYFAPTDPSGIRVDRAQRPELTLGTCEFLVPKEYWSKPPVPMRYLFVLDTSAESCSRGFLQGVCDGVLAALYGDDLTIPDEDEDDEEEVEQQPSKLPPGARVGFVTFDREMHFYNVSALLSSPQQLVMSDLEDPFAAISPEHLFVDPAECKSNIVKLLKQTPQMFYNIKHAEPALLPILQAALATLNDTGGKIICSLGSLPTYGPGKLFVRDKGTTTTEDSDQHKALLKTEYVGLKKLQADLVKAGAGIDFFLAAPAGGYLDIASIGYVAEKTGGETYYYPNWSYPRDTLRLRKELEHNVQREQGFASLMKVRCSNGLQVAHYSGNFTQHTFGADLELASITQETGMSVTFSYDGKLDPKQDAHFQSALLYTTSTGQRRVRCSNIVARVSESARDAMRFVDQDAVLSIMAKESVAKIGDRSLKDIRQALQDKTVEILAGYRKHSSGGHASGQLVLPEGLKEFAMYSLGLLKSRAIKGGREPTDRRIQEARMLKGMGPAETSLYLYPRMLAVHNLEPGEGFADDTGHLKMPAAIRTSFACIEEGGVYIVDNGQILLLWLHAQTSPNLLEDLFGEGMSSLQALDPNLNALPVLETHLNAQVRNVLLHLESQRGSKGLAIQLARQGLDGAEYEFARLLYEDRNGEASSYVDWLVQLHRSVGMELSGQKTKTTSEDVSQTVSNTISSITGAVWGGT
ncbi:COPII coat Sec23p-Sfb3p heterodimer component [Oleoguttula sp. CCFEE 5521]